MREVFHQLEGHAGIHIIVSHLQEAGTDTCQDHTTVMIFPVNETQGTNLALMETKPGEGLCSSACSLPDPVCKYAVKSRDTLS